MSLGILGAALFYGDGMITRGLGAVSCWKDSKSLIRASRNGSADRGRRSLLALHGATARHGKMGAAFGPVMLVWFIAIAVLGLTSLVQTPEIIAAVNPTYAVGFFAGGCWHSWRWGRSSFV